MNSNYNKTKSLKKYKQNIRDYVDNMGLKVLSKQITKLRTTREKLLELINVRSHMLLLQRL